MLPTEHAQQQHQPCASCTLLEQAVSTPRNSGKKRNKANSVCFSNKHTRKWQDPNLQHKKVYWDLGQRWVKLHICTKAIKSIEKNGLDTMAAEAGIDLWKLPFEDARPQRLQYLAENQGKVPVVSAVASRGGVVLLCCLHCFHVVLTLVTKHTCYKAQA